MANDDQLYQYEVPFESFVKPLPPHLQTKAARDALFPRFARLPVELQLHIVRHCDAPTLWRLMRTTSSLRREATIRFWNHADVWYEVDRRWFESRKGGYRHISDYQKSFWHSVEQIVFLAQRLEWDFEDGKALPNGMSEIEVKITYFWEMVQNSFPSAKRILLNNYTLHESIPAMGEDSLDDWGILRMLTDGAPKTLDVKLAVGGDQNSFGAFNLIRWKQIPVASNRWSGWKLLEERIWRPTMNVVEPGGWDLPDGPLRRYETMNHVASCSHLEWRLFRTMVLATHIRCSRGDSFRCPVDDCVFVIESGAHWHSHVSSRHYDVEISWASNTPRAMQDFIEYRKARAGHLQQRYEAHWLSIRKDMGDYDSFEWKAYMNAMEKELQYYLIPSSSPIHEQEMFQYMHNCGFSSCFDPARADHPPAIQGYDKLPSYQISSDDRTNAPLEVVADDEDSGGPQLDPERLREIIERYDRFWTKAGFVPRDTRSMKQPS